MTPEELATTLFVFGGLMFAIGAVVVAQQVFIFFLLKLTRELRDALDKETTNDT